jgi:hypothetical protein
MFRSACSVFAMVFCSVSTAAVAAEVVDMRLGRHPGYTRVVFELDAPAGYSLEQNVLENGDTELVVTLDASASDREKTLNKSLIKKVQLTGQGNRSVARIRLGNGQLRVKEMILGGPPRIVLDVLAPAGAARTAKAASSAPNATPAVRTAIKPRVARVSQPMPRGQANAPVASINSGAMPAPIRVAARPAAKPAKPMKVAPAKPAAIAKVPVRNTVVAAKKPVIKPADVMAAKQRSVPAAKPAAAAAKTPPPPARQKPGASSVVAPAAIVQSESMLTSTNIGVGLALLGFVGGGALFMMRRRGSAELLDASDFEEDPLAADNPFAELDDATSLIDAPTEVPPQAEETAEIPIATVVDEFDPAEDADIPVAKVSAESGPEENLFDTSATELTPAEEPDTQINLLDAPDAEGSGDDMEAYGDTTVNTNADTMPPIPGAGVTDNSDTMRMLREFEQRMASLEARLDEVSEAKERLERQVAAQTEELRVQRAAIARTQRALRNLSRPDDESPTEPALRDPNA